MRSLSHRCFRPDAHTLRRPVLEYCGPLRIHTLRHLSERPFEWTELRRWIILLLASVSTCSLNLRRNVQVTLALCRYRRIHLILRGLHHPALGAVRSPQSGIQVPAYVASAASPGFKCRATASASTPKSSRLA